MYNNSYFKVKIKAYNNNARVCPNCGKNDLIIVEASKYEPGRFLVKCDRCWVVSKTADSIEEAVQNWEEQKMSKLSDIVNQPLTKQSIVEEKALDLAFSVVEITAESYKRALKDSIKTDNLEKKKHYEEQAKMYERFFTNSILMSGLPIDGEDVISRLRSEVMEEKHGL